MFGLRRSLAISLAILLCGTTCGQMFETFQLVSASIEVHRNRAEFFAVSDLGRRLEFPVVLGDGADPTTLLFSSGKVADLRTSFSGNDFLPSGTLVDGESIDWVERGSTGAITVLASVSLPSTEPLPETFSATIPATLERVVYDWFDGVGLEGTAVANLSAEDLQGIGEVVFTKSPGVGAYEVSQLSYEFVPEPSSVKYSLIAVVMLFASRSGRPNANRQ